MPSSYTFDKGPQPASINTLPGSEAGGGFYRNSPSFDDSTPEIAETKEVVSAGLKVETAEMPPWRRRCNLGMMALLLFGYGACWSLYAPFFPSKAETKGLDAVVIGLIFSTFELVNCLTVPIFGYFTPHLGPRFMILAGTLMAGSCTMLFGILDWCPAGLTFAVCCFTLRFFEALGAACYVTATYSVAGFLSPDEMAFVYGLMEAGNGVGLTMGPALGGYLYSLNGFVTPYFTFGLMLIVIGVLSSTSLSGNAAIPKSSMEAPWPLFTQPKVVLVTLVNIVNGACYSFMDPIVSPRLEYLGLTDPFMIGLVFLGPAVAYGLSAIISGKVLDVFDRPILFLTLSAILQGFTYAALGPAPWLIDSDGTVLSLMITYSCIGLFFPFMMLAIPNVLDEGARECGMDPDALSTKSTTAAWFNCTTYIGSFTGQSLSGPIVTALGFRWSISVLAFMCWGSAAAIILFWLVDKLIDRSKVKEVQSAASRTTDAANDQKTVSDSKTGNTNSSYDEKSDI